MVLSILVVTVILANIILAIISSQSRLTHHQVSRIQAYYAAQAGMNLAMEQLRTGAWIPGAAYALCPAAGPGCTFVDPNIPYQVNINIMLAGADPDGAGPALGFPGVSPIIITTDYIYTP